MEKCVFCEIVAGHVPAFKVYENERVLAFLDREAVAEYHTLVIPKRHAADVFDVSDQDLGALMSAVRQICLTYRETLGVKALQIVSSSGAAAQQEVFHLHFHIVPRQAEDGLDIHWPRDPSLVERFEELLLRLRNASEL